MSNERSKELEDLLIHGEHVKNVAAWWIVTPAILTVFMLLLAYFKDRFSPREIVDIIRHHGWILIAVYAGCISMIGIGKLLQMYAMNRKLEKKIMRDTRDAALGAPNEVVTELDKLLERENEGWQWLWLFPLTASAVIVLTAILSDFFEAPQVAFLLNNYWFGIVLIAFIVCFYDAARLVILNVNQKK